MLSCLELQTQAGGWAKPQETPLGLKREINCLALPSPKLSTGATGAVITGPPPAEGTPPPCGHVVLEDLPGPSPLTSHRPSCSFSSPPGAVVPPLAFDLAAPLAWNVGLALAELSAPGFPVTQVSVLRSSRRAICSCVLTGTRSANCGRLSCVPHPATPCPLHN